MWGIKMKKHHKAGALAVLLIMIGFGAVIFAMNNVGAVYSSDTTVYVPNWVQLKCGVVEASKSTTIDRNWAWEQDKYTNINCNEFTKEGCSLYYKVSTEAIAKWYEICRPHATADKCNAQGCGLATGGGIQAYGVEQLLDNIKIGEYYKINAYDQTGALFCSKRQLPDGWLTIRKVWDEYGLIIQGNTQYVERRGTCDLTSSNLGRIEDGVLINGNKLIFTGGEGLSYVSYISDWVQAYKGSIYSHPQYGNVYCTGLGTLYKVQEKTMENGNKVVFAAGSAIFDSSIECCPQQPGCNANFKWDNQAGDCPNNLDSECAGQGQWFSNGPQSAQRYYCANTVCTKETKTVGCSTPADCVNGYCDMSSRVPSEWKCKSGTPPTSYCGDNRCDAITENFGNCPSDCLNQQEEKSLLIPALIIGGAIILAAIIIFAVTRKKQTTF